MKLEVEPREFRRAVEKIGKSAEMSRAGVRPEPETRSLAAAMARSIGLSSVPKESATPEAWRAARSSVKSLDPAGSTVPLALAVTASLSRRARSMLAPPASVTVPAMSKLLLPASTLWNRCGRNPLKAPSPLTATTWPASVRR